MLAVAVFVTDGCALAWADAVAASIRAMTRQRTIEQREHVGRIRRIQRPGHGRHGKRAVQEFDAGPCSCLRPVIDQIDTPPQQTGTLLKQGAIGEDDNARLEFPCLQAKA